MCQNTLWTSIILYAEFYLENQVKTYFATPHYDVGVLILNHFQRNTRWLICDSDMFADQHIQKHNKVMS